MFHANRKVWYSIIGFILVVGAWLIFRKNEVGLSSSANGNPSGNALTKKPPAKHPDVSDENTARTKPLAETNVSFSQLDQRGKFQNLTGRISNIKSDLDQSTNPSSLVQKIFSDIKMLDSFGRRTISGTLENELASLDPQSPSQFEWLAKTYPLIKKELQDFSFGGKTSELHLFSLLASNVNSMGVDPHAELEKLGNPETKNAMIEGLIPQLIIQNGDSFQEIVDGLEPAAKANIQQTVMVTSSIDRMYRSEALEMHLDNLGTEGNHHDLVRRWFVDSAWFWKNSKEIADLAVRSPPSPRRDLVITEIVKSTSKRDPESSKQWLPLISDQKLAIQLSKTIAE